MESGVDVRSELDAFRGCFDPLAQLAAEPIGRTGAKQGKGARNRLLTDRVADRVEPSRRVPCVGHFRGDHAEGIGQW